MRRTNKRRSYPLTPKSKWKTFRHCGTFLSLKVQICGHVHHRTNGQQLCTKSKNGWFLWKGICTDNPLQDCYGKHSSEKFYSKMDGRTHQPGNVCSCIVSKVCSWPCTWTTSKWQEGTRISSPCRKISWTKLIWRSPLRTLIKCSWDALNGNVSRTTGLSPTIRKCSSHEFLQELQKSSQILGKNNWKSDCVVLRHGRTRADNALNGTAV